MLVSASLLIEAAIIEMERFTGPKEDWQFLPNRCLLLHLKLSFRTPSPQ